MANPTGPQLHIGAIPGDDNGQLARRIEAEWREWAKEMDLDALLKATLMEQILSGGTIEDASRTVIERWRKGGANGGS